MLHGVHNMQLFRMEIVITCIDKLKIKFSLHDLNRTFGQKFICFISDYQWQVSIHSIFVSMNENLLLYIFVYSDYFSDNLSEYFVFSHFLKPTIQLPQVFLSLLHLIMTISMLSFYLVFPLLACTPLLLKLLSLTIKKLCGELVQK